MTTLRDINTPEELGTLLGYDYHKVIKYYTHRLPGHRRYVTFQVPKKGGGSRCISAPATFLKEIQRKLAAKLSELYAVRSGVHGFIAERSIVTGAAPHVRRRHVLNMDLKDFFPSIHFGRVRGMLMAPPYSINPRVALAIAQICCHEKVLPQGAPTSPVISNMVCGVLDSKLVRYASRNQCTYSRYADDITFSSNRRAIPPGLGHLSVNEQGIGSFELSSSLEDLVRANGFEINPKKTRLQSYGGRQVVTGIVVNRKLNVPRTFVRQIRATLHAWSKYGEAAAEAHHFKLYNRKHRHPNKATPAFWQVVRGKIEHVRAVKGIDDSVVRGLVRKFNALCAAHQIAIPPTSAILSLKNATFVIESDENDAQGTAFALDEVGFVTCCHVVLSKELGAETTHRYYLYRPENPTLRLRVKVVSWDEARDVAILRPVIRWRVGVGPEAAPDVAPLKVPHPFVLPDIGDPVTLAGFPKHGIGRSITIKAGSVAAHQTNAWGKTFKVTQSIVAGNSGGPVIDKNGRVVGIAHKGYGLAVDEITDEHLVIPISVVTSLVAP